MNRGNKSKLLNDEVNKFTNQKELKLSDKKCGNIHIGNKASKVECPKKVLVTELLLSQTKRNILVIS